MTKWLTKGERGVKAIYTIAANIWKMRASVA